ncbi:MAG: protein phosphatase 2C domain-containing protein, partial [Thermoanaerobaculia bacterium]|nr:protein phosphatase 2C domain-containing protein [Thermoanaerobaculia bacterium]
MSKIRPLASPRAGADTGPATGVFLPVRWEELTYATWGASDAGRRSRNEDHYLVAEVGLSGALQSSLETHDRRQLLLAVADGVGGQGGGQVASELAIRALHWRLQAGVDPSDSPKTALIAALQHCDDEIRRQARWRRDCWNMATALTVGLVVDRMLYVAHVGHGRAYLLRDGDARLLTRDHTLRQSLLEGGASESELASVPTLLTQAVGGEMPTLDPQLAEVLLRPGDRVVLCSDGVSGGSGELRRAER